MERNVYISIRGLHQMEDEDGAEENVEIVSPGEYFVRNGKQSTLGYQPDVWKKWE